MRPGRGLDGRCAQDLEEERRSSILGGHREAERAEIAPDTWEEPALQGSPSLRPVTPDLWGWRGTHTQG